LAEVLPVYFSVPAGPLYSAIMGYKESPVDEARRRCGRVVHDLFETFLSRHGACVTAELGGQPDIVLPVPSTARPSGPPLAQVSGLRELVDSSLGDRSVWDPTLLRRSTAPVGHMRPHRDAFALDPVAPGAVRSARVVLLDDTYVTGARSQSAAATLRLSGARATLIVPMIRLLRPDRSAAHATFMASKEVQRDRCPRCAVDQAAAVSE
jgi:glutamine phosphoribosylpyrophosphate amidotransferase